MIEITERDFLDMKETLVRIETKLDQTISISEDHEKRIRVLEGKAGKRWETVVGQVIALLIAAAIGYFLKA